MSKMAGAEGGGRHPAAGGGGTQAAGGTRRHPAAGSAPPLVRGKRTVGQEQRAGCEQPERAQVRCLGCLSGHRGRPMNFVTERRVNCSVVGTGFSVCAQVYVSAPPHAASEAWVLCECSVITCHIARHEHRYTAAMHQVGNVRVWLPQPLASKARSAVPGGGPLALAVTHGAPAAFPIHGAVGVIGSSVVPVGRSRPLTDVIQRQLMQRQVAGQLHRRQPRPCMVQGTQERAQGVKAAPSNSVCRGSRAGGAAWLHPRLLPSHPLPTRSPSAHPYPARLCCTKAGRH